MFWKDCLLGKIHFSNERSSCQSLFWNDGCLASSIFLTRNFQLIRAKENFRLAPSRISWQKFLSHFNICLEITHPGLFLPLSCRWNYQSSVQVEKETNEEQRTEAQTSENRFLISLAVSSGSRDGSSLPKVPLLWPLPHCLYWTQVQATESVFVNTFCMLLLICR